MSPSTEPRTFLRELRSAYGPAYDVGRGAIESYGGTGHWKNEWRWRQSAEGIELAFRRHFRRRPESVLELGCGTGRMTAELRARGLAAWGLDWGGNIQHEGGIVADVLAIPFRRRFDLVVALDLVEHVPIDLQPALFEELRRVTGRALIATVPTEEPHYTLDSSAGVRNHYLSSPAEGWRQHFSIHGFETHASGDDLARLGVPFSWGATNFPFLLRREEICTS